MSEMPSKESLVLNPSMRLEMTIYVNQRGSGPKQTSFFVGSKETLVNFLLKSHWTEDESVKVPKEFVSFLREAGVLIPESQLPGDIEFDFSLPLSPPELLPAGADAEVTDAGNLLPLEVSPGVHWSDDGDPPDSVGQAIPKREFTGGQGPILWVEEPGPGIVFPYRVPSSVAPSLRRLIETKGQPVGAALDQWRGELGEASEPLLKVLRQAHILVSPGQQEGRRRSWDDQVARCRQQLAQDNYTVIEGLLSPVQLALLRRYYRGAKLAGALMANDMQVRLRSVRYNEVISSFIHHQTVGLLNRIIPSPVKASYCYLTMYEPQAVLDRHVDRPQCRWNLSVMLDADPETNRSNAWPIYLEVGGEAKEVRLGLGDCVLYSGTELPHWRPPQPMGAHCTVSLFHYVDEGFVGSLR